MKTWTTLTIISILLTASLLGLLINLKPASANPDTIQVTRGGSIQAAINSAHPNDIIFVEPGTYRENLEINQSITLKGSGQNVTTIQASANWKPVVDITINNVNVTGFTIQGGSNSDGISINGYNASRISENRVTSNSFGIQLSNSHNNHIFLNTISLNKFDGVNLVNSNDNMIYNNTIMRNGDSGFASGIALTQADSNRISNNTIALHQWGTWLDYSNNNIFDGNTISNNDNGVSMEGCYSNSFYHNNFVSNMQQVDTLNSVNSWNMTNEGNYWSDYTGQDANGDGVGDTPYIIDETNQDNFPLIHLWYPPKDVTPPFTTDDYDNLWHTADFSIKLTAVDDLSGVNETFYRINDAAQVSNVTAHGQPYIATEGSSNTLEYWSTDRAGNNETHHILTNIKLDKTLPSGSIQINDGDTYANSPSVTLTLSATDSISGISEMRFSNDNTTWTSWESYSTSKAWNLKAGDGTKTVYVIYRDNAGLNSRTSYGTIILDANPPAITILSPKAASETKSQNVTITWNGTDAGSGIDHFEIQLDGGALINVGGDRAYTFTGLADGAHTVTVKAFDKTGHGSEESVAFTVNTAQSGGVGYLEIAAIIAVVVVVVAVVFYFFRVRNKGRS